MKLPGLMHNSSVIPILVLIIALHILTSPSITIQNSMVQETLPAETNHSSDPEGFFSFNSIEGLDIFSGKSAMDWNEEAFDLKSFISPLINHRPEEVVGIYAHGSFALPVTQQPEGNANFVSSAPEAITQYHLAHQYGSIGLLAHNYLSGSHFYRLERNQEITVVFGDGRMRNYRIKQLRSYQAVQPRNLYSKFIDLSSSTREEYSSSDLFDQIYGSNHRLVLQTCIKVGDQMSWGRFFVIADPVETYQQRPRNAIPLNFHR